MLFVDGTLMSEMNIPSWAISVFSFVMISPDSSFKGARGIPISKPRNVIIAL